MYSTHQRQISEWAALSPKHMQRVLVFVVASIRQPLFNMPADMQVIEEGGEEASSLLFGHKWSAYTYINNHADRLWYQSNYIFGSYADNNERSDRLVELFADIPGIGMVKAGFCVQLLFGQSGCIDTNNVKRFGLPERAFRTDGKAWHKLKQQTRARKIREYNSIVDRLGGTATLWDTWCGFVANRSNKIYRDAFHVSQIHVDATVRL